MRWPLGLSGWRHHDDFTPRMEIERVGRWTPDQVRLNTTMANQYTESSQPHNLLVRARTDRLQDSTTSTLSPLVTSSTLLART